VCIVHKSVLKKTQPFPWFYTLNLCTTVSIRNISENIACSYKMCTQHERDDNEGK